jgi:hypothetical protein
LAPFSSIATQGANADGRINKEGGVPFMRFATYRNIGGQQHHDNRNLLLWDLLRWYPA